MSAPSVEDVALAILFQLAPLTALSYDFHADERESEDQRDALTAADLVTTGLSEAEMGGATVMLTIYGRRFSLTVEEDEPVEPVTRYVRDSGWCDGYRSADWSCNSTIGKRRARWRKLPGGRLMCGSCKRADESS